MKSLVCDKPFNLKYIETEKPDIKADELLVKVSSVGICGTDIHAYTGNQPFFSYPRVLGHELCGIVEAVGENENKTFKTGDKVALIPYVACQQCPSCLSGKTNCCENISVIGVHEDGGFSEYLAVPKDNVLLVNDIDNHTAALIEPFAISAHGVRRANLKQNEHVLVVGAGPIGLGAAAIAAADGAHVLVADTQPERREHVKTYLNLPTLNPIDDDFHEKMSSFFNGALAETVIDATGNAVAMNTAVNHIRHGGKIVFIGLFKGNIEIHDPDFHKKETTLIGSRNATREDFEKVLILMEQGKLKAEMMQTHTFDFHTIGMSYEESVINNRSLLKGVIDFI
ncbi:zinc-binding alcohol dehydrogenase family protein [Vibrio salinus]|uniref:zinc-binding alcohol dehydrogenase family protein n=1 Tax=Vibrio salinus TaxID=2899784 RepID=UPI001E56DADC|nr:zinc-binding alcohol dehydrogenase family protein [Vibrio salinus]MCE0492417.1 zinc-binding alcohol dehydrogenase family protein [Vibrio salinus]